MQAIKHNAKNEVLETRNISDAEYGGAKQLGDDRFNLDGDNEGEYWILGQKRVQDLEKPEDVKAPEQEEVKEEEEPKKKTVAKKRTRRK